MSTTTERFEDHGITGIRYGVSGNQYTTCPRCSHERKKKGETCLSVDAVRGIWNCHHCNWSGILKDTIDYRKERVGRPRKFQEFPPPKPEPIRALPADKVPAPAKGAGRGFAYLEEREIPREIAEKAGVYVTTHFFPDAKKKLPCLAFPFHYEGQVVNIKFRTREKNFAQTKGGAKVFYGIDRIADQKHVVITEGEIDALSWLTVGLPAISVPDGAPNANAENVTQKMRFLDNCFDKLEHVERFYLATDADANGFRLREELARRLGPERCWVMEYPEGCKDSNEALQKFGPDALRAMYAEADLYPVSGIASPAAWRDVIADIHANGFPDVAGSGEPDVDDLLKLAPGGLTIVTGIPGHGKSTFLDWLLTRYMVWNQWRIAAYTPETSPPEIHIGRLLQTLTGGHFLPSRPWQMSREQMEAGMTFLERHLRYMYADDYTAFTIDAVLESAAYLVRSFGVNAVVIDPFNKLKREAGSRETEREYIARVMERLSAFSRQYRVHVILVAHPRKPAGGWNDRRPELYDVSGSADFANMTDNGFVVYQQVDEQGDRAEVEWSVKKVKFEHWGRLGEALFRFDPISRRYYPAEGRPDRRPWIDENGMPLRPETADDRPLKNDSF